MQGASGDLHREDDYVFRDDGKPYDCDVAFVKTIAKEESARCGGQPRHKAHPLTPHASAHQNRKAVRVLLCAVKGVRRLCEVGGRSLCGGRR